MSKFSIRPNTMDQFALSKYTELSGKGGYSGLFETALRRAADSPPDCWAAVRVYQKAFVCLHDNDTPPPQPTTVTLPSSSEVYYTLVSREIRNELQVAYIKSSAVFHMVLALYLQRELDGSGKALAPMRAINVEKRKLDLIELILQETRADILEQAMTIFLKEEQS